MGHDRLIFAALLAGALALGAAGCGNATVNGSGSTGTAGSAEVANPWVEVDALDDAGALAGFDLTVPETIEGYDERSITVMEGQVIQVLYTDSATEAEVCIRKGTGDIEDISGDHNNYQENSKVDVDGRSVELMGNNGTVSLASWIEGDYVYSVGAYDAGISAEAMETIVAQVS